MALPIWTLRTHGAACSWDRPLLAASFVFALVLAIPGPSAAEDPEDPMEMFKLFDENGDGVIDETEFRLKKIRIFNMLDTNGNLVIDRGEIRITDDKFVEADPNKDGVIDSLEFDAVGMGNFSTADTDGDGKVTPEEFVRFVEEVRS